MTVAFFIVGVFVVAVLALTMGKRGVCRRCKGRVHPAATVCRHCGYEFTKE